MADKAQLKADKAARKAQKAADRAAAKAQRKADRKAERDEANTEKQRIRSLAQMAEDKLLADLKASLKTHARSATFACGGRVPFKTAVGLGEENVGEVTSDDVVSGEKTQGEERGGSEADAKIDPVDVWFGESGKAFKLSLPMDISSSKEFEELLKACQPASFGRGGKEVLDEDYRKAGKLDTTAFATTFCPYKCGIVDTIAQLLLPQTAQDKNHRSIKAELYKLNVYSAPSGKFKAHVDTPRDTAQFGSLVVSLPVPHLGGELAVRNADNELVFDWSAADEDVKKHPVVEWAAFYSDCEHEVFEVTSGHRVTLTYNLHVTRGQGHLTGSNPILDPSQLPLFSTLSLALSNPGFLRRGRILAIWLTHSYAHTNTHINFLPSSLKGADMSLWETANALGLWCRVVPMITTAGYYDDEPSHLLGSRFYGFNGGQTGNGNLDGEYMGWGQTLPRGKVTWINPSPKKDKKKDSRITNPENDAPKDFKEAQLAYLAYGNEPDIDIHYSRAAMLIRIPPFRLRGAKVPKPKGFWDDIKPDYDEYDDEYDDEEYDEEWDDEYSDQWDEEESSEGEWSSEEDYDEDEDEEMKDVGGLQDVDVGDEEKNVKTGQELLAVLLKKKNEAQRGAASGAL